MNGTISEQITAAINLFIFSAWNGHSSQFDENLMIPNRKKFRGTKVSVLNIEKFAKYNLPWLINESEKKSDPMSVRERGNMYRETGKCF